MFKSIHKSRFNLINWLVSKRRLVFWGATTVVILAVAFLAFLQVFSAMQNRWPIFTDATDTYFEVESNIFLADLIEPFSIILSEAFSVSDTKKVLSTLIKTEPETIGAFIQNGDLFWFAKNPRQDLEFFIKEASPNQSDQPKLAQEEADKFLTATTITLKQTKLLILSDAPLPPLGNKFSWQTLWQRLKITKLIPNGIGVFFAKAHTPFLKENGQAVYGQFRHNNKQLVLDMAFDIDQVGQSIIHQRQPDSLFYLTSSENIKSIPWSKYLEAQNEDAINLSNQMLLYPGGVTLYQGSEEKFFSNPYQGGVVWQVSWQVGQEQAQNLLNLVLDDLSRLYPQSKPRVLPDGSRVFELEHSYNQFLAFDDFNFSEQLESTFTYTEGQLRYKFTPQDGLIISKGLDLEGEIETVDNSCVFEGSILTGSVFYDQDLESLWKRMNFSLDQQRMVVCIQRE